MKTRGLIAIDIDGTLTAVRDHLAPEVTQFLQSLVLDGWKLLFVTGRTLSWSTKLLKSLPFPFFLSVFNGAYTVEMPDNSFIHKKYLSIDHVYQVMGLVGEQDIAIACYSAPDRSNRSFLYRNYASHLLMAHLTRRQAAVKENWIEIANLTEIPTEAFAAIRLFCLPNTAKKMSLEIEEKLTLHAPMMRDSYDDTFSVVQVTHGEVSKGDALARVLESLEKVKAVIACGDDRNDISMLKLADVPVVMATAPGEVLELARVIAPAAKENGIITGIKNAVALLEKK